MPPIRLLILDDDKDTADSIKMYFDFIPDIEAHVAYTSQQAIAEASKILPDVLILDIGLPKMDGIKVAEQLRAFLPHSLFIASTGFASLDIRERAGHVFNAFLVKPYRLSDLTDIIRTHAIIKA